MLLQHKITLFILSVLILFQMTLSTIFPYLTKFIIDDVLMKQNLSNLKRIFFFTIVIILLQIPINIGVSYYCSKWTQLVIYKLRQDISKIFISQKENANDNGLFVNTITNDCELIGNQLLSLLLNGVPNILLILLYMIVLFQLNFKLTIIALLVVPLYIIMSYITSKKVFVITKELQKYLDKLIEFLNSYVRNKLLIDLYNLKESERRNFEIVIGQVKDSNVKANTILSFFSNLSGLVSIISPLLILFIGSIMVIKNELSIGSLIAFNSYIALLFVPLGKLLNVLPIYSQMKVSIERVEQSNYFQKKKHNGMYIKRKLNGKQQINVQNLIPYVQNKPLLKFPLSFSISKGEVVLMNGPNGVGKSIILKSLVNYFDDFSGCIEVQKNINIVYVPQENFLFEGTVLKNIVIGIPMYSKEKLHFLVNLLKFDVSLEMIVTPFNINLSSGQLQKIKLMHAFLSNPDVLLLDETLANLDNEIVKNVIQYIKKTNISMIFVYHGEANSFLLNDHYKIIDLREAKN